METSVLRRLKDSGRGVGKFHSAGGLPWILAGGLALAILIIVPLFFPKTEPWAERIATALALFWFILGVSSVLGLRARAPWIAAAVTVLIYAATAWLPAIGVRDLFVLTLLVGFGLFVLAGFNLLFVLEEVVYDIHRLLRVRGQTWLVLPLLLGIVLVPSVFLAEAALGWELNALKVMVPFGVFMVLIGWLIRWRIRPRGESQLREIHLLVVGAIAGAGLADAVALLKEAGGLVPSIVAYLTFIFTWLYVTYTALQRAQYFIPGQDILPWIAVLLSSSFAIVAHVHSLYDVAGQAGLQYQVDLRVGYLVFGVWLGLTFFVLRGLWRTFQFIRDERTMGRRVRRTAGTLARVTEELIRTEDRIEGVAYRALARLDRILPGGSRTKPPKGKRPRKKAR